MTKNKLIVKQQLKIQAFKKAQKRNKEIITKVRGSIHGIGQPLNDNVDRFNPNQLAWVKKISDLLEELVSV